MKVKIQFEDFNILLNSVKCITRDGYVTYRKDITEYKRNELIHEINKQTLVLLNKNKINSYAMYDNKGYCNTMINIMENILRLDHINIMERVVCMEYTCNFALYSKSEKEYTPRGRGYQTKSITKANIKTGFLDSTNNLLDKLKFIKKACSRFYKKGLLEPYVLLMLINIVYDFFIDLFDRIISFNNLDNKMYYNFHRSYIMKCYRDENSNFRLLNFANSYRTNKSRARKVNKDRYTVFYGYIYDGDMPDSIRYEVQEEVTNLLKTIYKYFYKIGFLDKEYVMKNIENGNFILDFVTLTNYYNLSTELVTNDMSWEYFNNSKRMDIQFNNYYLMNHVSNLDLLYNKFLMIEPIRDFILLRNDHKFPSVFKNLEQFVSMKERMGSSISYSEFNGDGSGKHLLVYSDVKVMMDFFKYNNVMNESYRTSFIKNFYDTEGHGTISKLFNKNTITYPKDDKMILLIYIQFINTSYPFQKAFLNRIRKEWIYYYENDKDLFTLEFLYSSLRDKAYNVLEHRVKEGSPKMFDRLVKLCFKDEFLKNLKEEGLL